jgi:hypothetical protein
MYAKTVFMIHAGTPLTVVQQCVSHDQVGAAGRQVTA